MWSTIVEVSRSTIILAKSNRPQDAHRRDNAVVESAFVMLIHPEVHRSFPDR